LQPNTPAPPLTPLYVDDSPEAWELFRKAGDQYTSGNLAEAVRLYQKLLREFPRRLIPSVDADNDRLVTVRDQVIAEISKSRELLQAYRDSAGAAPTPDGDDGDLLKTYLSDYLSGSGLASTLRLARRAALDGRFASAEELLAEAAAHPLATDETQREVDTLHALIAVYTSPSESRFTETIGALRPSLGSGLDPILRLASARSPRRISESTSVLNYRPHDVALQGDSSAPVWKFQSGDAREYLLRVRNASGEDSGRLTDDPADGYELVSALPVIHGDLILIASEDSVSAVDRYDGTLRWRYPSEDPKENQVESGRYNPYDWPESGPTAPAIVGNSLIASLHIDSEEGDDGSGYSALYCLNLSDGTVRWSLPASRLGNEFAFARFNGTPLTAEGRVVAAIQKRDQSLAGDFLVGLDAEDGSIAWTQHVASTGLQSWNQVSAAPPIVMGADVVYASALGAICRIGIDTGIVRWMRRIPADVSSAGFRSAESPPWEYQEPVLAGARLFLLSSDRSRVLVIDPESGALDYTARAADWSSPHYLIGSEGQVYAVGTHVARIDADHPEQAAEIMFEPADGERLLGRALLSDTAIYLPMYRSLRVISLQGSEATRDIALHMPGVPIITNNELVISTIAGIDSYLPFESGAPQLTARMHERPGDPSAAISLANLAFRHGRWDAILPAADAAYDAIHSDSLSPRNQEAAARLFASLLQMGQSKAIAAQGLGDAVFRRLGSEASTPQQRLAYAFQFAAYLQNAGRMAEAVDQYQNVLQDQALAAEFWSGGGRNVRAGLEASRRIRQMASASGWGIYDFYEKQAFEAMTRAVSTSDLNALDSVTRLYPVADASARAALAAGRIHHAAGRTDQAIRAYRSGLLARSESTARGELLGELVSLLRNQGLVDAALNELVSVERSAPMATVVLPDHTSVAIATLREQIAAEVRERERLAVVGAIMEQPFVLIPADELLEPASGRSNPEVFLVRSGMKLKAYSAPELSERWSVPLTDPRVGLVSVQGQDALLLQEMQDTRRLVLIDLQTGMTRWESEDIDLLLAGSGQHRFAEGVDEPYGVTAALRRITTLVTPNEVVIANELGQSACLERTSGSSRWTALLPISALNELVASPSSLIVSGRRFEPTRKSSVSGCILRIDPADGTLLANLELGPDENPTWTVAGQADEAIFGTSSGVYCYDFLSDGMRWALTDGKWHNSQRGFVDRGAAYVRLESDRLVVIKTEHGAPATPAAPEFALHPNTSGDALIPLSNMNLFKEQGGLFTFLPDGTLQGRLVGNEADDLDIREAAATRDRIIVLEARTVETQPGSAERRAIVYALDATGRRIDREFEIVPPILDTSVPAAQVEIGLPTAMECVDGWIILAGDNAILGIRAPGDPSAPVGQ